jgi:hypothetical protein
MWALGLLWTGIASRALLDSTEIGHVVQAIAILLALLVPACLIVFSLRDRKKPDRTEEQPNHERQKTD